MVYLIFLSAIFSKTHLFFSVTLGDALAVLIILTAIMKYKFNFKYLSPRNHKNLSVFVLWIIISGGFIYVMGLLDVGEFSKSLLKLIFYVGVYYSAYTLMRSVDSDIIFKQTTNILTLNSVIAIYVLIAIKYNLPFNLFWYGLDVPEGTAYYAGTSIVRARGVFTEPAILGYFLVMGLAFVLLNGYKMRKFKALLIWLGVLLTFSVTTYFLAFIVILVHYRNNLKKHLKLVLVMVVLGATFYSIPAFKEPIQMAVVDRVLLLFEDNDGRVTSGSMRLNGTWDIALGNLEESYLLGSGLGNHSLSYSRLNGYYNSDTAIESHSILSYVLGTTGVVGFLIFLSLFKVFKFNKALGVVFFASMFVNGNFLSITFWIFYCLFSISKNNLIDNKKTLNKNCKSSSNLNVHSTI